jgi:hypothetical protein
MNILSSRWISLATLVIAIPALSACGWGDRPPEVYVLGDGVPAGQHQSSQLNSPIVEVKPVRIPDYLDNKDIVVRHAGGQIVASTDARWGERLSLGVTRAVAASLAPWVPRLAVTTTPPLEIPRWRVLIDIYVFDVQSAGQCVLAGRWSVWTGNGEKKLRDEKFSMSAPIGKGTDPEVVASMTRLVDRLAANIAPALEAGSEPGRIASR